MAKRSSFLASFIRKRSMGKHTVSQGARAVTSFDFTLLFIVLGLTIFGLVMVYDSSVIQSFKDYGNKNFYIRQQMISAFLGLTALTFFSFFNYKNLKKLALPIFIGCVILILAVFIPGLGSSGGGAHRWLRIFGFTLQPTELVKLGTVIFFATLFEKRMRLGPFYTISAAVTIILAFFQKDLGSGIVYFLICIGMYIYADAPLRIFTYLMPASVVGFVLFVLTSEYRQKRILAFLDPFADPQGYTYHISQILIALGSGGWFGLGLGQSKQKFEYIPEVTTDSIFSIIGEELGFFGALILIGLIAFLIYRGFYIAEQCTDRFGKLLAFGITFWLGVQAAVNLGAMVSLIPLTGVPLPFISYGGSALIVNLAAIGILLNISRQTDL